MARRVYWETVKAWFKKQKWYVSGVGSIIGAVFVFLVGTGGITITGYSSDIVCAGTPGDPCISYINFTSNEDVFWYKTDFDPWGRNTPIDFDPGIKDWVLQRKWGNGWRTINFTKGCTGSWCGCYWCRENTTAEYAWVTRAGGKYEMRILGYKYSPYDDVKWGFGIEKFFNPDSYVDPVWFGVKVVEYDEETVVPLWLEDTKEWIYQNYTTRMLKLEIENVTIKTPVDSDCSLSCPTCDMECRHPVYIEYKRLGKINTNFVNKLVEFEKGNHKELDFDIKEKSWEKGNNYTAWITYKYPWTKGGDKFNLSLEVAGIEWKIDPVVSGCTDITGNGTYTMNQSISNSGSSNCINISSNDVVFDCAGYTIDGNDVADDGIIIYRGSFTTCNITVSDCEMQDWDTYAYYSLRCGSNNVTNLNFTSLPDYGIHDAYGAANNYTGILIEGSSNAEIGVLLYRTGANIKFFDSDLDAYSAAIEPQFVSSASCTGLTFSNTNGSSEVPIVSVTSSISDWYQNASELIICDCDNCVIDNVTINNSANSGSGRGAAMTVTEGTNLNITNCHIYDSYDGIVFEENSDGDIVIDGNTFEGQRSNDIEYMSRSDTDTTVISSNTFIESFRCLRIDTESNFNVTNNTAESDNDAWYETSTCTNLRAWNNVFNLTEPGDVFFGTWVNVNTTEQAGTRVPHPNQGDVAPNIGGNYYTNTTGNGYSDTCTDDDVDGFCDDSYLADAGDTDYLPYSDEYIADTTSPFWSDNSTNTTLENSPTLFSVFWWDTADNGDFMNLSHYIFSWYNATNWTSTEESGDLEDGTQSFQGEAGGGTGAEFFDTFEDGTNWTEDGNCAAYWTYGSSTPSGGTGPQDGDSDDAGSNFVFMETSSGNCDGSPSDGYLLYNEEINWDGGVSDNITFETNRHGTTDLGTMIFQENSTGSWVQLGVWNQSGADGNSGFVWTEQKLDASSLTGSGFVRFYSYDHSSYQGDAAIDKFNITSITGSNDNDTDKSFVEYNDISFTDVYEKINWVNVTINVTAYDNSGSSENSNSNPNLWLELNNNSDWFEHGNLSVSGTGNVTVQITDSTVLSAWVTAADRDIRIRSRYMDYHNATTYDEINWTGVWVEINSEQEWLNDSAVAFSPGGNESWSNVTKTVGSGTIKWKVYANDSVISWNVTDEFSYETTGGPADSCSDFDTTGWIDCADDCVNSSVVVSGDLWIGSTGVGTVNLTDTNITGNLYFNATDNCIVYIYPPFYKGG